MSKLVAHLPLAAKVILTIAFVAAGGAKLTGAEPMVAVYDAIGWGQWFRYLTGAIEVGAVVLLWVPGFVLIGAGLLVCTMLGAILAHLLVLGPSIVPALILGLLALYVALTARRAT